MGKYFISINQYADFVNATERKRLRIIKDQQKPNVIKISYYQLAKGRIKKSLAENGAQVCIREALALLAKRIPVTTRQKTDKAVSIEALGRYLTLNIPKMLLLPGICFFKRGEFKSSVSINGVDVIIAPDLIFKVKIDGRDIIGGLKLHIGKKAFEWQQQQIIASGIYQYMVNEVVKPGQHVDPDWCISLDIFGNGFVSVPAKETDLILSDATIYEEIKRIWDAA